jgi:hypothetical protein
MPSFRPRGPVLQYPPIGLGVCESRVTNSAACQRKLGQVSVKVVRDCGADVTRGCVSLRRQSSLIGNVFCLLKAQLRRAAHQRRRTGPRRESVAYARVASQAYHFRATIHAARGRRSRAGVLRGSVAARTPIRASAGGAATAFAATGPAVGIAIVFDQHRQSPQATNATSDPHTFIQIEIWSAPQTTTRGDVTSGFVLQYPPIRVVVCK